MSATNVARQIAASLAFATVAAGSHAATYVYVSNADSQEISVLQMDRASGALTVIDTVAVGGTVMPMAISPDKRVLYAALRSQPFRVATFAIDPATGKLKKLGVRFEIRPWRKNTTILWERSTLADPGKGIPNPETRIAGLLY